MKQIPELLNPGPKSCSEIRAPEPAGAPAPQNPTSPKTKNRLISKLRNPYKPSQIPKSPLTHESPPPPSPKPLNPEFRNPYKPLQTLKLPKPTEFPASGLWEPSPGQRKPFPHKAPLPRNCRGLGALGLGFRGLGALGLGFGV